MIGRDGQRHVHLFATTTNLAVGPGTNRHKGAIGLVVLKYRL
jgi:hypothetical protein